MVNEVEVGGCDKRKALEHLAATGEHLLNLFLRVHPLMIPKHDRAVSVRGAMTCVKANRSCIHECLITEGKEANVENTLPRPRMKISLSQRLLPTVTQMTLESHSGLCEINEMSIFQEVAVEGRKSQSSLALEQIQIGVHHGAGYRLPSNPVIRGRNGRI